MREIGMPFRDDMAAAIRKGLKTQFRLPIALQPEPGWVLDQRVERSGNTRFRWLRSRDGEPCSWLEVSASEGDRIFVQEDWIHIDDRFDRFDGMGSQTYYRSAQANYYEEDNRRWLELHGLSWQPANKMPSRIARTWLEITEIRAQRIQSISEEDAEAEGVQPFCLGCLEYIDGEPCEICGPELNLSFRRGFEKVWDSLYPGSWERNDWVFAATFKVVEGKGRSE